MNISKYCFNLISFTLNSYGSRKALYVLQRRSIAKTSVANFEKLNNSKEISLNYPKDWFKQGFTLHSIQKQYKTYLILFRLNQTLDTVDKSYVSTWICSNPEAVAQRCSVKKVLLEISHNSQENTCVKVSLLIKLQASGLQLY